ncbi:MAG: SdiA-regulated domain-containing protein [Gemmatimonadaceae bacterium]
MKWRVVAGWLGVLAIGSTGFGHVASIGLLLSGIDPREPAGESALGRYDLSGDPSGRVELPGKLTEISGLAVSDDGRMFAHNDERSVISELDVNSGQIVKSFALGDPIVRGDFEGLAIAGGRFYIVTSEGIIYETGEGTDGERVPFKRHITGLGTECEIEGLAYDPASRTLLLACKECRNGALCDWVTVFRWSIAKKAVARAATLRIPFRVARDAGLRAFNPSGIERDPKTGNYLIVSAQQRAIIELTATGKLVASVKLEKRWHRQSEGITILPDLTLVVSDEGRKKERPGSMTFYASRGNAGAGSR